MISLWVDSPTGNGLHEIKIMDATGQNAFMLTSTNSPFTELDDIGVGVGLLWIPQLAIGRTGGVTPASWPPRFTNFTLQASRTLAPGSWTNIVTATNITPLNPTNAALFFRMRE